MKHIVLVGLLAAALAGCGGQIAQPTPAPIGYGIIVGYDEVTTGHHVADIELNDVPPGSSVSHTVELMHEGTRVEILETRDNGDSLKVRTPSGAVGWTQIDFVKRQ